MRNAAVLAVSLACSGCAPGDSASGRRVDAQVACERSIESALVSGASFKRIGHAGYKEAAGEGRLAGKYQAANAFGVQIESGYNCTFDPRHGVVTYLRITGPFGSRLIVGHGDQSGADREAAIKAGAARMKANVEGGSLDGPAAGRSLSGSERWVANGSFHGCPKSKDWYGVQDKVESGSYEAAFPPQCFTINPGDIVLAAAPGKRPTSTYHGHTYEQASLQKGGTFWSDGMDKFTLTRVH